MRASEFVLDEGKASRRKQASMNARRRAANTPVQQAPVQQAPVAAPVAAPVQQALVAAPVAAPVQQAPVAAPVATQAQPTYLDRIKQKLSGMKNPLSTQSRISSRTNQIFIDKFLKDMNTAEQTSTGLRGEAFDVKNWVNRYLLQNKWDAGDQQSQLDNAIEANDKKAIAKTMAAIGKYNNLGSTIAAKAAAKQAPTPTAPAAPAPTAPTAPTRVAPARPSGAPTPEEEARLQQRIQQQLQRQGQA